MLVPLPLPLLLPLRCRAVNSAAMSRVAALTFGRVLCSQQRQCHSSGPAKPPSASTTTTATTATAAINTPQIPVYQARDSESVETKRSRLLYQSRKRGMLENGLVLSTFASRHLAALTANQLNMYDTLINQPSNDWDIYYWVTGAVATPAEYDNEVMAMLKAFVANKDRESRLHQPSLYAE